MSDPARLIRLVLAASALLVSACSADANRTTATSPYGDDSGAVADTPDGDPSCADERANPKMNCSHRH